MKTLYCTTINTLVSLDPNPLLLSIFFITMKWQALTHHYSPYCCTSIPDSRR